MHHNISYRLYCTLIYHSYRPSCIKRLCTIVTRCSYYSYTYSRGNNKVKRSKCSRIHSYKKKQDRIELHWHNSINHMTTLSCNTIDSTAQYSANDRKEATTIERERDKKNCLAYAITIHNTYSWQIPDKFQFHFLTSNTEWNRQVCEGIELRVSYLIFVCWITVIQIIRRKMENDCKMTVWYHLEDCAI